MPERRRPGGRGTGRPLRLRARRPISSLDAALTADPKCTQSDRFGARPEEDRLASGFSDVVALPMRGNASRQHRSLSDGGDAELRVGAGRSASSPVMPVRIDPLLLALSANGLAGIAGASTDGTARRGRDRERGAHCARPCSRVVARRALARALLSPSDAAGQRDHSRCPAHVLIECRLDDRDVERVVLRGRLTRVDR